MTTNYVPEVAHNRLSVSRREIARRAASGLSSRAIAARLVVAVVPYPLGVR
jgi:DNA-binding CsgD family transcriptional regulator